MTEQRDLKIFIVDDNKMLLKGAKGYLEKNVNCTIHCFDDVISCMHKLDEKPDYIFLDYHFHHTAEDALHNGKWALLKIKKQLKETPVIVVSSEKDIKKIMSFMKLGATDFIPKGVMVLKDMKDKIMDLEYKRSFNQGGTDDYGIRYTW